MARSKTSVKKTDMDKALESLDKAAKTKVASQSPFEKGKRRRRRFMSRTKDKLT